MKKFFYLLFVISFNCFAQNLALKIIGKNETETKKIDSIGYTNTHVNTKVLLNEVHDFSKKLLKFGYLESKIDFNNQINDSVYNCKIILGKKTLFISINISNNLKTFIGIKNDTLKVPFSQYNAFIKNTLKKLETNGFSMAKVNLINITAQKDAVIADLRIDFGKKRQLNDIVINGYDKFPVGHLKSLKRIYKNKVFNAQNLEQLSKDFDQFRFVKQIKYPEILFKKDSTKIYVYVEKTKNNTFDGFLGFTNDDKKNLIFSGYINLILSNILNSGEKLIINWRSNGNEQRTFNAGVEIPYIFKSPISLKANLNIIKQDSTFQTTQTALDLGYYFNYNSRFYLGYQSSESSDIKNLNTATLSDFTNDYVTANFEYLNYKSDSFLFTEKTNLNLKIGTGNRYSKFEKSAQFFGSLKLKHDFYLNDKNCINLKSQNFYLQSNQYIINELYRFGGINSIRGFSENSLQGSFFTSLLTEYRYIVTSNLYVHSIIDYGYYQDRTTNKSDKLVGLGFGFGLLTKNGLFNLIYANGSSQNQQIQLSNSIVQISLKANF